MLLTHILAGSEGKKEEKPAAGIESELVLGESEPELIKSRIRAKLFRPSA